MGDSVKVLASVVSRRGIESKFNNNDFYMNGKFLSESDVDVDDVQASLDNISEDFIFAVCNSMSIEDLQDNSKISVVTELKKLQERMKDGRGDIRTRLSDVCQKVEETNSLIYSISLNNKDNTRNEAAFSGLVLCKGKAAALSIGDSNAYIFRSGQLKKLILDREKPDRLLKMGIINEEQARSLSRNVGPSLHESLMGAQISEIIDLNQNDIYLLCSQRIENTVDEGVIADILLSEKDTGVMANRIVKEAKKNGIIGDITVLVVKIEKIYSENELDPEKESYMTKWSDKLMNIYDKKQESIRTFIIAALTCIILVGIIAVTYRMLTGDSGKETENTASKSSPTALANNNTNLAGQTGQNQNTSTVAGANSNPTALPSSTANSSQNAGTNQRTGTQNANAGTNGSEHITYKVEPGDTLEKISKKFYNDPSKYKIIMERNNIKDPTKLKVGEILIIP